MADHAQCLLGCFEVFFELDCVRALYEMVSEIHNMVEDLVAGGRKYDRSALLSML